MKKLVFILAIIALTVPVLASDGAATGVAWGTGPRHDTHFWNKPLGKGWKWHNQVENLLAAQGRIGPTTTIRYVDSNVSNAGNGANWANAVATIDGAINLSDANDLIYVAPGHAETIASATGFVCDVAGISIIGIGYGSLIPTISLGTSAEAAISVTGANTRLSNLKIVSALADVESGINLSAAADGSVVDNCYLADGAANLELLVDVNVAADCDNIRVINNQLYAFASSNTTNAVVLLGGSDNSIVSGNLIYGTYTSGGVDASTAASTNLTISNNVIGCIDAIAYAGHASTTGLFHDNRFGANTTSIAAAVTGTDAMFCWENYTTGALNASGIIDPAVDAD